MKYRVDVFTISVRNVKFEESVSAHMNEWAEVGWRLASSHMRQVGIPGSPEMEFTFVWEASST